MNIKRRIHIFYDQAKTWPQIFYWFTYFICFYKFLNLKLFLHCWASQKKNNSSFICPKSLKSTWIPEQYHVKWWLKYLSHKTVSWTLNQTIYNRIRWFAGTNDSSTKPLMFQVLLFFHNFFQNSLWKWFQFILLCFKKFTKWK